MSAPPFNPDMQQGGEKNFGEAPPPYPGGGGPPPGAAYPPPGGAAYPAPQPNYGQPMQGAYPQPMMGAPMMGGQNSSTTTTTVVMSGNCPGCHMGNLVEETDTGALVCIIILVVLFFPIGLLYLLCLPGASHRRCPHCGYHSD